MVAIARDYSLWDLIVPFPLVLDFAGFLAGVGLRGRECWNIYMAARVGCVSWLTLVGEWRWRSEGQGTGRSGASW
jgi:hypothetical protein